MKTKLQFIKLGVILLTPLYLELNSSCVYGADKKESKDSTVWQTLDSDWGSAKSDTKNEEKSEAKGETISEKKSDVGPESPSKNTETKTKTEPVAEVKATKEIELKSPTVQASDQNESKPIQKNPIKAIVKHSVPSKKIYKNKNFSRRTPASEHLPSIQRQIEKTANPPAVSPSPISEPPPYENTIGGNFAGRRKKLSDSGVDLTIVYKGEMERNFSGGIEVKNSYLENLDIKINLDGDKLFGWSGISFFVYALGNKGPDSGNTPSVNVGDEQGVSNIQAATDDLKLYELWMQKTFYSDRMSVLLGLHDLNSEFYVTDSSGQFFNSSFGVGRELSQTGIHGPSIFPYTSGALRLRVEPSKNFYLMTAIFGAQAGDPDHLKGSHIRMGTKDGFLWITEAGVIGPDTSPGKMAIGSWRYTNNFGHQDTSVTDANGISIAYPVQSSGTYLLIDHSWNSKLSTFARYGIASTESNRVKSNASAGIVYKHPFGRENDSVGFATTQVLLGSEAANIMTTNSGAAPTDSENSTEINYRFGIANGVVIQPSFQIIKSPGFITERKDSQYGAVRIELNF